MKIIIAASAFALMTGAALAQATTPATPSTPPATTPQATTPAPAPTTPRAPSAASASSAAMTSLPSGSTTVTNWYKQNVYASDGATSIGQVKDVLLSPDGKVAALVIAVGGFLGMGDHDVAVPFDQVKHTVKDGKAVLSMNASKDTLKSAPGLRYDSATTSWVPEGK